MNSLPLSWMQYNDRRYLANHVSSTSIAIYSAYLLLIAAISAQLDPSSIIVSAQICTVFVWILTPSSASSNSHLIFYGPHRSTESNSQGLITLSSRSGSLQSLTTFVSFISLHVSYVPVISFQRLPMPVHVKLSRTLSSSLLAPGYWSVSWYHSRSIFRSDDGSQILSCPSCPVFV